MCVNQSINKLKKERRRLYKNKKFKKNNEKLNNK